MSSEELVRTELHERLDAVVGSHGAAYLMARVAPMEWDKLATKDDLADLRQAVQNDLADVRAQINEVRTALGAETNEVRTALGAEIAETRTALGAEIAETRTALGAEINEVRTALGAETNEVRTALGAEIAEVRTALGAEINEVRTALGAEIAETRRDNVDLRKDVNHEFAMVRVEMTSLKHEVIGAFRGELTAALGSQARILVIQHVVLFLAFAGFALATR